MIRLEAKIIMERMTKELEEFEIKTEIENKADALKQTEKITIKKIEVKEKSELELKKLEIKK